MAGPTSDQERWRQVAELLDQVLELPRNEVTPFLDRACDVDPELRAEVQAYLEAEEQADDFLDVPAVQRAAGLLEEAGDPEDTTRPFGFEGCHLGPYQVLRQIGGGGMGVVYEAWDQRLGRSVALKLLPESWSQDDRAKKRFLREARAASRLDHLNICTVHDVGEHDGRLFIVMTYYEGETLKERIGRGPLAAPEARELIVQIARGLQHAHQRGIVHRDVKPANVIITDNSPNRAVILDFGIAKLADDIGLTHTGTSPGTPAYMSPEQARGESVDERSDIWSLGVMLHEMLTGLRPFRGQGPQAVIHAILNRAPEPLEPPGGGGVDDDLARSVSKALAKGPGRRYQNVGELLADLDVPSGAVPVTSKRLLTEWVVALTVLVLAAAFFVDRLGRAPPDRETATPVAATAGLPSLAVLYFQNLTGDEELDWLRSGLTEMLVTNLSQSRSFQVLSTSRLYQVLGQLEALETANLPLEMVRELAEQAGVETVVRGSYARLGDVIRIVYQVEQASTGTTLVANHVEGQGTESLFGMIDEVSSAVRRNFEDAPPQPRPAPVSDVTTSSIEAWRLYSAGAELQHRSLYRESITLLEKAVETDPGFALALSELGRLHRNLGHAAEAREYLRRAIEHAERLGVYQRLNIQGSYYGDSWQTYPRAIEALEEAVRLYPERENLRNNLAALYGFLERYEEAAFLYENLVREGTSFSGTAVAAASMNAALGRFESGYSILSDFAGRHPGDWYVRFGLGWLLTEWGKLDEAAEDLAAAAGLRPKEFYVHYAEWRLRVLREDRSRAAQEADAMAAIADPHARWRGALAQARNLLYQGRSKPALERLEAASRAYSTPVAYTASSRCLKAQLLLRTQDADGALRAALRAQEEARGQWPELRGLFLAALAHEELGRHRESAAAVLALEDRTSESNVVEKRQRLHLSGLLSLARGDATAAVESLEQAAGLLPPRGIEFHRYALPDHVPVWYALGEAELASGRPRKALGWFRKVMTSGVEHVDFPVLYVRGFYFLLGKIHDELGQQQESRLHFERFLDHWEDGDLDRHWVAQAQAAVH